MVDDKKNNNNRILFLGSEERFFLCLPRLPADFSSFLSDVCEPVTEGVPPAKLILASSSACHLKNACITSSPSRSPLASDCSSRRSSISSTSSLGSEAKPEGERVRHREVEKLLRAVADGDVEMVRYLLEWMDEEEDEGEFRSEALLCHPLCQCPTCAPTQKLSVMQAGTLGVNSCNTDGFTPLHVAALHGHSALAALLIRHGASVNARTNQSATPLHLASQNSHIQLSNLFIIADITSSVADSKYSSKLCHDATSAPEEFMEAELSSVIGSSTCIKREDLQTNSY
uniref:ankyrin repeat domain-containing protein 27-like n=1 Tax=Epinephelus lanceolatus TaxID=310571 RepID=UPI0014452576|nr:ankyrin repeat domain-containing protein 27-like [Epinephelus lanceolatus]